MKADVVIVAGGSGVRFGQKKQFFPLGGIPVLQRTIRCFDDNEQIDQIVVVVPEDDIETAKPLVSGLSSGCILTPGGKTRQESVINGLRKTSGNDLVLIHDGVRPFVGEDLIARVIDGMESGADACIPGLSLTDTIKEAHDTIVTRTVPRKDIYRIQTPQAFKYSMLVAAHEASSAPHTDDSALIEENGGRVRIVEGDPLNMKITNRQDIKLAEAILRCHFE